MLFIPLVELACWYINLKFQEFCFSKISSHIRTFLVDLYFAKKWHNPRASKFLSGCYFFVLEGHCLFALSVIFDVHGIFSLKGCPSIKFVQVVVMLTEPLWIGPVLDPHLDQMGLVQEQKKIC